MNLDRYSRNTFCRRSFYLWLLLAAAGLVGVFSPSPLRAANDGQLILTVVDEKTKKPVACRMHLSQANKRPHRVKGLPFWHDHFVFDGQVTLRLPIGDYYFEIERGLEYLEQKGHFTIERFADDTKQIELRRFVDMADDGWYSGDFDIRRPVREIELLMRADDLHLATVETDSNRKKAAQLDAPKGEPFVRFDWNRYYSTRAAVQIWPGGNVSYLNRPGSLTFGAPTAEHPSPLQNLSALHEADGWADLAQSTWWDLPLLVAQGQVDSIRIANEQLCRASVLPDPKGTKPRDKKLFPGARGAGEWTQDVYFRLLDCGLKIPPSAGSGSGASPNPVGYNRMYVHIDGPMNPKTWFESLRAGRVTITNGPLMRPRVHGQLPGYVFQVPQGEKAQFEIDLTLSTREKISYLEIIKDGQVYRSVPLDEYAKKGQLPPVEFDQSGWFLVRAVADRADTYRFAMTGPYYVEVGYQPRISREAAKFFVDWVFERARQVAKIENPEQRKALIEEHRKARDYWQNILSISNAS